MLGPIYIYNLQEGFRSLAVLEGLGHLFDLLGRSFQSGQSLRGVPALPERLVLQKSLGHPGTITPKNIVPHMRWPSCLVLVEFNCITTEATSPAMDYTAASTTFSLDSYPRHAVLIDLFLSVSPVRHLSWGSCANYEAKSQILHPLLPAIAKDYQGSATELFNVASRAQ